jgi:hypothetical protein
VQHVGIVLRDLESSDGQPRELAFEAQRPPRGLPRAVRNVPELVHVHAVGNDAEKPLGDDAIPHEAIGRGLADDRHVVDQAVRQPIPCHQQGAALRDIVDRRHQHR